MDHGELSIVHDPLSIEPIMFEQAFKNIDDVLWKEAGCTTELDYTEQTSWLLFLKYLDALGRQRADTATMDGWPRWRS
jgi:type I restriction enzyme M protein